VAVSNPDSDDVVAITNDGHMLMFKVNDLPELAKGKGNKIIGIPSARVVAREEYVQAYAVLGIQQVLVIHSGKRFIRLNRDELEHYRGERGRRGNKLPRGFQKVDRVAIEDK
jgi:topoisomerase-4 subunit A